MTSDQNVGGVKNFTPYSSPDSAPIGYASARSVWLVPSFLIVFALVAAAIIFVEPWLSQGYIALLGNLSSVTGLAEPASLGLRPIIPAFVVVFWLFTNGTWTQRVRLFVVMALAATIVTVVTDSILLRVGQPIGFVPFTLVGNIIVGYASFITILTVIMVSVRLPQNVRTVRNLPRPRLYMIIAFIAFILTLLILTVLFPFFKGFLDTLRDFGILGGVGPSVLLFTHVLWSLLFVLGTVRLRSIRNKNRNQHHLLQNNPSIGIVIPAYNEALGIADCIHSLDLAAANYSGTCRLYLVDNGSTDKTIENANYALANCRNLKGEVLICPQRGKAAALNHGVRNTIEEVIMRLDADTMLDNDSIKDVAVHFNDPSLGIVGGIPLPKAPDRLLARMRAIEVYYHIGFARVGHGALDAILCVPGIYTAYRRSALTQAGDFSEGLNGEDTDMTVRIGRLGYRILIDPRIHVFSEVPESWAHLREQRIRWSRSVLHVFARNVSAIWMRQGVRGIWLLPNSLWGQFRRMLVLLFLVYGVLVLAIDPSVLYLRDGAALLAIVGGPSFVFTLVSLLVYRRIDLLIFAPAYLGFRLVRAYFSLDMLFTLPLSLSERQLLRLPVRSKKVLIPRSTQLLHRS